MKKNYDVIKGTRFNEFKAYVQQRVDSGSDLIGGIFTSQEIVDRADFSEGSRPRSYKQIETTYYQAEIWYTHEDDPCYESNERNRIYLGIKRKWEQAK